MRRALVAFASMLVGCWPSPPTPIVPMASAQPASLSVIDAPAFQISISNDQLCAVRFSSR